ETDATAFAVNPYGRPASISIAVTTATPVAKWPITRRSSLGSSAIPLAPARRPRPQVLLAVADRIQQPVPARIGQRERRRLRQEPAAHLVGQLDAPFARRHLHPDQAPEHIPARPPPQPQVPRLHRRQPPRARLEHARPL